MVVDLYSEGGGGFVRRACNINRPSYLKEISWLVLFQEEANAKLDEMEGFFRWDDEDGVFLPATAVMQATLSLGWTGYSPCRALLPAAGCFCMTYLMVIIGYYCGYDTFPFYSIRCGSSMPKYRYYIH